MTPTSTLTSKQFEKISKALGDSNRLKILHFISNKGGCGQCSDIHTVVDLAQPSISHHVKILIESGLIEPEKEGRNHKYTLNEPMLDLYIQMLNDLKHCLAKPPDQKNTDSKNVDHRHVDPKPVDLNHVELKHGDLHQDDVEK
ncbi:ArsR/SmtB family transcription factor [Flavitalea sp.]|nr:metalloregulator ArsR/SmtB family transcription factor [Flavitalea sp.]